MREPVDGPVLLVMAVDSVDQAIALANDSEYGLGASVWTADRYMASRIARELHAGMVWLNDHLPGPTVSRGPWGAAAGGGLGRTLGQAGLRACAQEKLITWDPPRPARACGGAPYDAPARARRGPWRRMRSGREADRERGLARPALRARARRGCRARARPRAHRLTRARAPHEARRRAVRASAFAQLPFEACPPRPMQARSASASCAGGSATRAACRGCCDTPFYIACLKLTGRRCVVIGGGEVGAGEGRGPARLRRRGDPDRARGRAGAAGATRARARSAGSSATTPAPATSRAPSWRSPPRTTPT